MKKCIYYMDQEMRSDLALMFPDELQVILTGKQLRPSYPGCEVTAHDRILSESYDLHLSFHKDLPQFSFYPVPQLLIFAIDSLGGCFCSTNPAVNLRETAHADIYYLDQNRQIHWLAGSAPDFLSLVLFQPNWKEALQLPGYVNPKPSEQGKSFLATAYKVPQAQKHLMPASEQILLFASLAEAQASLPFIDPVSLRPITP